MDEIKEMTEGEKLKYARVASQNFWNRRNYAEDRGNKINDAIRLIELQIATIIFAFTAVFPKEIEREGVPFWILVFFSIGLIALVFSVVFGLVNEFKKLKFWQGIVGERTDSMMAFQKVLIKESTLKEAFTYQTTRLGGIVSSSSSPDWPLILQTFFLAIGSFTILTIKIIHIFS